LADRCRYWAVVSLAVIPPTEADAVISSAEAVSFKSVHWCPVKYFSDPDKSLAIRGIAGVWPKNDLN
jgi:hypothetical protein